MKENEFGSYLAKEMNTSVEQIRETYAASEREDSLQWPPADRGHDETSDMR